MRQMENFTVPFDPISFIWYMLPTVGIVPAVALPSNALVIRLLLGKTGICSTSEIFMLHLAMLDMLFCVMLLVEYVYFLFEQTLWAASFVAWGVNQGGGPLLLCLMSVDSYLAVCHPLLFRRLKDPKLRLLMCSLVNAVTMTVCALVKQAGNSKWLMLLVIISGIMMIISTCNILILKSLRQRGPSGREVHPVKKRAFKTVLSAYMLVIVHYLPPMVEHLLTLFGPQFFRPFSVFTSVTFFALSLSSVIQPLCYLTRNKQLPQMRCPCCPAPLCDTKTQT